MKTILIYFLCTIISGLSELCNIIVPENPLSTEGISKPYITNCLTDIFVEMTIFNVVSRQFYIYNPTVTTSITYTTYQNPEIPDNSMIGIWFSSNNTPFRLSSTNTSLIDGNCIDGYNYSYFEYFAYCNARNFFMIVNRLLAINAFTIPSPTYLTNRNYAFLYQYDNPRLLSIMKKNILEEYFSFTAPDILNTIKKTSLALNELQANLSRNQVYIPIHHPVVLVNNKPNLEKLNLYRIGVNQPILQELKDDTLTYCINICSETKSFLTITNIDKKFIYDRFNHNWNIMNCKEVAKTECIFFDNTYITLIVFLSLSLIVGAGIFFIKTYL